MHRLLEILSSSTSEARSSVVLEWQVVHGLTSVPGPDAAYPTSTEVTIRVIDEYWPPAGLRDAADLTFDQHRLLVLAPITTEEHSSTLRDTAASAILPRMAFKVLIERPVRGA